MRHTMFAAALAATVAAAGSASAQDAAAGEKVFRKCKACHQVEAEKNGVGPHLVGVVGREVGAIEGYKYSKAMIEWGEGKAWDQATLDAYLEDPKGVVKGTKMSFRGLKKEADRANVIAYLEANGPES